MSKLQPWSVISSRIIHKTSWIEVIEDTCIADGKEIAYTYTRRVDEGPLIIAETSEKKLWLVRQYRHPIKKIVWQFPSEGKYPQESWEEAARRGLVEELHLQAEKIVDLGEYFADPGGLEQKYHAFLASGLSAYHVDKAVHQSDEIETLEIQTFSRIEIDRLIAVGEVCDNWTMAALFLYDRFRQTQKDA